MEEAVLLGQTIGMAFELGIGAGTQHGFLLHVEQFGADMAFIRAEGLEKGSGKQVASGKGP